MESPKELVRNFFATYPTKHLGKGQILLRPDDKVTKIFYIVEGSVVQYDISLAGNTVILNVYKAGTYLPMSKVINKTSSHYFFEADSPLIIKVAPASQVLDFLKANPTVSFDLLRRVYKGTDGLLGRLAQQMGGTAFSRVAFELLNASYRFGETNSDGSVFIAFSENDIAKRSGLSRETVNRMIKQLKKDHLVRVTNAGIEISDVDGLEAILRN